MGAPFAVPVVLLLNTDEWQLVMNDGLRLQQEILPRCVYIPSALLILLSL